MYPILVKLKKNYEKENHREKLKFVYQNTNHASRNPSVRRIMNTSKLSRQGRQTKAYI
jgi:hypothetical protein